MTRSEAYMQTGETWFLHTYNRFPIVLEKGKGAYLYDAEGRQYLDFAAGIAVCALGYGNRNLNEALKAQIDKLAHTSNLYYSIPAVEAAKALCEVSGMDRVFFTNSGTEAIEGAIKSALKYAYSHEAASDYEIIAMEESFHGRSMGALSVTGNPHYREAFGPGIGNIRFARFNDLESVRNAVTEKTCAVILEPIQGEGGIHPADPEFLQGIRSLCDEKGILLILDEIQCGMGRTGSMFAFEEYGIRPDILTTAKALGCGVPVGAFLMTEKVAEKSLVPGDHGSTYGGNPLACAAVCEVLRQFSENDICGHVKSLTPRFTGALDSLAADFPAIIKERRGRGFMQALELTIPAGDVIRAAQAEGLLVISAGSKVLRLVPPLIIGESEIDEMERIFRKVFQNL